MDDKQLKSLEDTLKFHARGLKIPVGSANEFIALTLKAVQKTLKSKSVITEADLIRVTSKELKKYHPDLAYVYQKYDKII